MNAISEEAVGRQSGNIAAQLSQLAAAQPDTLAIAMQSEDKEYPRYTYRELHERSDQLARGLQELGIGKGTRTVLMVKPGLDFFSLAFALFKVGAVLVAVDPGMGIKNLGTCLQEAGAEAFIGIRQAHLGRLLFGWAKSTIKIRIVVEPRPLLGIVMKDMRKLQRLGLSSKKVAMQTVEPADAAAILFTSGSTGVPKGVHYTHANFNAQIAALKQLYTIRPGEIDLATFPLFALFAPALGMTAIIPQMDFTRPGEVDAAGIIRAINDFGASSMFGSPALLDRVGRWGRDNGQRLPSLKRVVSAGAPVPVEVIRRFAQMLKAETEIFTPYGATEALPVASIGSRELISETGKLSGIGRGVCVGRPVAGLDVAIIATSDEVIADWGAVRQMENRQVGEIAVKGAQVTASYFNREEATALAKIYADDGSFYHRMGDLGYFDEQGRLWFCGRKSERVELSDRTLYTSCCEGIFNTHARVLRTALVKITVENKIRAALCVELEADSQHTNLRVLVQELLDLGSSYEQTAMIRHIFIHPGFPVDIRHNAKIDRAQLGEWAEQQL